MSIGIQISFKDEAGKTASTSLNVPTATTAANAALAAQAAALLIDEITDAQITGMTLSLPVSLPAGLKTAPVDGARVGVGALFSFLTTLGHITKMVIPARVEAIILDETDVVDLDNTDVANFIAEMQAGLDLTAVSGTGTVSPTDTRNEDINGLDDAYEVIGGKRR